MKSMINIYEKFGTKIMGLDIEATNVINYANSRSIKMGCYIKAWRDLLGTP